LSRHRSTSAGARERQQPLEIVGGAVVSGAVVVGNGVVDVFSGGTANVAFLPTGSGGSKSPTRLPSPAWCRIWRPNHANRAQFIDLSRSCSAPPYLQPHAGER
jgi:hypothetical protein